MPLFEDTINYVASLAEKALGEEDVYVSVGGSSSQLRSEFIVRELPENVRFEDHETARPAVMGRYVAPFRIEFDVACEAWCKKSSLTEATGGLMRWMELFNLEVLGDRTLGGLAVHAVPYAKLGGTARDTASRLYTAAYDFGVHVKAEIVPQEG